MILCNIYLVESDNKFCTVFFEIEVFYSCKRMCIMLSLLVSFAFAPRLQFRGP